MFRKTRRRIFVTLFAIPTLVLAFLGLFVGVSFSLYLRSDFRTSLGSTLDLAVSFYQAEKERLTLKADDFFASPDVAAYLGGTGGESAAVAELNDLDNSSALILGCYLYSAQPPIKSNQLSGVPSYEKMRELAPVRELMNSGDPTGELALIRDEQIPTSYSFGVQSEPELGIFSLLCRSGSALLVLDLATDSLYARLFDFGAYRYLSGSFAALSGGAHKKVDLRRSADERPIDPEYSGGFRKLGDYYYQSVGLDKEMTLNVCVPAGNLDGEILQIGGLTALTAGGLALVFAGVSAGYARRKTRALEDLNRRMKNR